MADLSHCIEKPWDGKEVRVEVAQSLSNWRAYSAFSALLAWLISEGKPAGRCREAPPKPTASAPLPW